MHPTTALLAGLVAGIAIAVQVGAVSLLLIEASIASGPRAGVAAGMGVATADFAFAVVAAAAGGAAGAALSSHESEIKVVAALTLAAISIHGLVKLRAERRAAFAAVAAALSLDGAGAAAAFAVGVGLASAGWHLVLTLAAGHAGRWITPRIRRGLAIGGRLAVLAIAAHLAL